MDYLFEYLLFLAEAVTIVVAVLVVISAVVSFGHRHQGTEDPGHLQIRKLNERLRGLRQAMESALLPPDLAKKKRKREAKGVAAEQKAQKVELKALEKSHTPDDSESTVRPRSFVIRFNGDLQASKASHLRLEISAVLTMATENDEVIVAIESPGGVVHSYGFAASQLSRVREAGIPLTAIVDKVAASGGYLMAAVANRVIAAPFALVGSIGVVAQVPNVHRLLKKNDVDVEVITAGKHKRTLTVFGENTEEGKQKFIEELEDVHALFQEFVAENRPGLDLDTVATGEAWYGKRALDLGLVDRLATSDEYLMDACEKRDVYEVRWVEHKKPLDKFMGKINGLLDDASGLLRGWHG